MKPDRKIQVGVILGAHGVRGAVRLRSLMEKPESIFGFNTVSDESGARRFALKRAGAGKDHFIVTLQGVGDRNAAEALRGVKLFVGRTALPPLKKRAYYAVDLVGLNIVDRDGKSYGSVLALHDYGAGAFLEIKPAKGPSFMLPFNDMFVPEVDLEARQATVVVPDGWLTPEKPPTKPKRKA